MFPGYSRDMKAVWLQVPEWFLRERSERGEGKRDEVWDGVLHMVPPAAAHHVFFQHRLRDVLNRIAEPRGLVAAIELSAFDPAIAEYRDFRVPDVAVVSRELVSNRGFEGNAALVVEVLSRDDESRAKLPFYARIGIREVWLIDREKRQVEVFRGTMPIDPEEGLIHAPSLGLELRIEGAGLVIRDGAETYTVDLSDTV